MGHGRNGKWWMTRPPDYPTTPQSRTGPVRDCLPLHTVPPTPPQRRCPGPPSAPPTTTKGRHRPHLSESSADRRVPRPSPLVLTPRPLRIGGFGLRNWLSPPVCTGPGESYDRIARRYPGRRSARADTEPEAQAGLRTYRLELGQANVFGDVVEDHLYRHPDLEVRWVRLHLH